MAKLIYAAITSLDGYVADPDGNFDWAEPDEEVRTNYVQVPGLEVAASVSDPPLPQVDRILLNVICDSKLVQPVPLHPMVVVVAQRAQNHQFSELVEIETGIEPVVFLAAVARAVDSPWRPVNNLVIHQPEILLDNRFPIAAIGRCIMHADVEGVY
jgi:hypothetical protein